MFFLTSPHVSRILKRLSCNSGRRGPKEPAQNARAGREAATETEAVQENGGGSCKLSAR